MIRNQVDSFLEGLMLSRHRSPTHWIRIAVVVCLVVLTQAGCTTLPLSRSLAPGPGQPEPGSPASGGSRTFGTKKIVGITILGFVGGYILYRLFFYDSEKDTGNPEAGPASPGPAGVLLPPSGIRT